MQYNRAMQTAVEQTQSSKQCVEMMMDQACYTKSMMSSVEVQQVNPLLNCLYVFYRIHDSLNQKSVSLEYLMERPVLQMT